MQLSLGCSLKTIKAKFLEWLTIQDVVSTTPILSGSDWVFEDSGIGTRQPLNIICYGNSVTKGTYGSPETSPYPTLLAALLPATDTVINRGFDARSGAWLLANYATYVTANLSTTKKNVLVVWEILNDVGMVPYQTPQNAYENIRDICLLAKAQGVTVIVGNSNKTSNSKEPEAVAAGLLIANDC